MTDRRGSTATGGAAPADQPGGVRNVVLVGHSGSGKTTLVEALLSATGTIQRMGRVEDGTTVSDFDEVEIRQQRSVNLTVAPLTDPQTVDKYRAWEKQAKEMEAKIKKSPPKDLAARKAELEKIRKNGPPAPPMAHVVSGRNDIRVLAYFVRRRISTVE